MPQSDGVSDLLRKLEVAAILHTVVDLGINAYGQDPTVGYLTNTFGRKPQESFVKSVQKELRQKKRELESEITSLQEAVEEVFNRGE